MVRHASLLECSSPAESPLASMMCDSFLASSSTIRQCCIRSHATCSTGPLHPQAAPDDRELFRSMTLRAQICHTPTYPTQGAETDHGHPQAHACEPGEKPMPSYLRSNAGNMAFDRGTLYQRRFPGQCVDAPALMQQPIHTYSLTVISGCNTMTDQHFNMLESQQSLPIQSAVLRKCSG